MRFVRMALAHLLGLYRCEADTGLPELPGYSLYVIALCPYCSRVKSAMKRLDLKIRCVDIDRDRRAREDLLAGGGKIQVPCLRIDRNTETQWLYESTDIIDLLSRIKQP